MKRLALVLVLLCLAGLGLHFYLKSSPPPASSLEGISTASSPANSVVPPAVSANSSIATSEPSSQSTASPNTNLTAAAATAPATLAGALEDTSIPTATLLENMRTAVKLYGQTFGGNPVGTNPEITSALNGNNPKQIKFIRPDAGLRINANGELIDSWGTPFFFHQLSGSQTEIRSAGPDRKMWTSDDLVIE